MVDFDFLFSQALAKIKSERNSSNIDATVINPDWNTVKNSEIFNFSKTEFEKQASISELAKKISISVVNFMILRLLEEYGYDITVVPIDELSKNYPKQLMNTVRIVVADKSNTSLLLFKEVEESCMWKTKDAEVINLKDIIDNASVKHVYYMLDYAYLQVIGHNNDVSDPGRGYNLYSLKWFFENYFGLEEYTRFQIALKKYLSDVKNYLGYICVKTLTPNTQMNFRKITDYQIQKHPYETLISKVINKDYNGRTRQYALSETDFALIKKQYFEEGVYNLILGTQDYSESIITAEWLYNSMKKAQAIDLTTIGMGYFKAVEQIMWALICLHKNENRLMKKDFSYKELESSLEVNDSNIQNDFLDTTLGSMAVFYKNNMDVFRNDLSQRSKEYIREALFDYGDLRNGYFHKHNIRDWNKINEIRDASFNLLFMLLGAFKMEVAYWNELGFLSISKENDYYRLCEYFDYHKNTLFFLKSNNGSENIYLSCQDAKSYIDKNGKVIYSGVYCRDLGKNAHVYRIGEDNLPVEIYLATLSVQQTETVKFDPIKIYKVWDHNSFVGPSIVEEEFLDY